MGGFLAGLGAFIIFGATMGIIVFLLTFLGASSGAGLAVALRVWGRRIQWASALLIAAIGALLIYSGISPGTFDALILT